MSRRPWKGSFASSAGTSRSRRRPARSSGAPGTGPARPARPTAGLGRAPGPQHPGHPPNPYRTDRPARPGRVHVPPSRTASWATRSSLRRARPVPPPPVLPATPAACLARPAHVHDCPPMSLDETGLSLYRFALGRTWTRRRIAPIDALRVGCCLLAVREHGRMTAVPVTAMAPGALSTIRTRVFLRSNRTRRG